jgi:hypothetical protein
VKFSEVVEQARAWLAREGRVSYRALKREFDLDDEFLEDVKAELIEAKRLAIDEEGKVLRSALPPRPWAKWRKRKMSDMCVICAYITVARQLLAEIYNWFTEGFDTKDLQEAKTLLKELGH